MITIVVMKWLINFSAIFVDYESIAKSWKCDGMGWVLICVWFRGFDLRHMEKNGEAWGNGSYHPDIEREREREGGGKGESGVVSCSCGGR